MSMAISDSFHSPSNLVRSVGELANAWIFRDPETDFLPRFVLLPTALSAMPA
jgi:hypothetical protein